MHLFLFPYCFLILKVFLQYFFFSTNFSLINCFHILLSHYFYITFFFLINRFVFYFLTPIIFYMQKLLLSISQSLFSIFLFLILNVFYSFFYIPVNLDCLLRSIVTLFLVFHFSFNLPILYINSYSPSYFRFSLAIKFPLCY